MGFYLTVVLLVGVPATVMGFPTGAPMEACDTISPNPISHRADPQTTAVPYTVNISSLANGYVPGRNYPIELSGTDDNEDFRGFLVQGRVVASGSMTGVFADNGDDQQVVCTGSSSITHVNNDDKTLVQLIWTAPAAGTGPIQFRFAMVDVTTVYWANRATNTINEVGGDNGAAGLMAASSMLIMLLASITTLIN